MIDYVFFGMSLELFSLNSFLNDIVDLEEFEKECVFEMLFGYIQEFLLIYLILLMLEFLAENYNQCKDVVFFINIIRIVFILFEVLNDSFRIVNGEYYNFLDVFVVREVYKFFLSLEFQNIFVQLFLNFFEIYFIILGFLVLNLDGVVQLVILIENLFV